jgi:pyrroloquinoline quinone biosynthesis protein D
MLAAADRPRLARKARLRWDAREERYLLLYPERGLLLNEVGASIVKRCDGAQSVAAIIAAVQSDFPDTPPATVERETLEFLAELAARRLVEVA